MKHKDFWEAVAWNDAACIKHSSRITGKILLLGIVIIISAVAFRLKHIRETNTDQTQESILYTLTGVGSEFSQGYDAGKVLSIDGTEIAKNCTAQNGWTKYCALPGYNGVLGSSGSGGAIKQWNAMLYSADTAVNREMRCGNSVQTTLSSAGQETAAASLAAYCTADICDSAALCVVLRDGAILVSAGNNTCTENSYFIDTDQQYIHENYCAEPYAVGSVAKILMARVLQLHDNELPEDYSVYNPAFTDISFYTLQDGNRIHNHDCYVRSAYCLAEGELLTRLVSLSDALKYSSNTYFIRHMETLGGFSMAYDSVSRTFGLSLSIQTESVMLDAVTCEKERLPYFMFGQDFFCSPIRLCQVVNHALSGEAYTPFLVAAVYLPDGTEIYRANPEPRVDYSFSVQHDDILRAALVQCFESYEIDDHITAPYTALIESGRILTKSGTADTVDGFVNTVRVMTVLDEDGRVAATACILVHNVRAGDDRLDKNVLYKLLFDTLHASGVL